MPTKHSKKTSVSKMKNRTPKPARPVKRALAKSPKVKSKPVASKPPVRKGYTKPELDRFKEIILEKRKEILEELESLKSSMMDVTTGEYVTENSTYSLHMEQGTDAMEREKTFLFASREGKFLNYLDDALKRIETGSYGFCTECGTLIDKARLEAVPHAQQCVKCKMKKGS